MANCSNSEELKINRLIAGKLETLRTGARYAVIPHTGELLVDIPHQGRFFYKLFTNSLDSCVLFEQVLSFQEREVYVTELAARTYQTGADLMMFSPDEIMNMVLTSPYERCLAFLVAVGMELG